MSIMLVHSVSNTIVVVEVSTSAAINTLDQAILCRNINKYTNAKRLNISE